jgi:hypothetical protein
MAKTKAKAKAKPKKAAGKAKGKAKAKAKPKKAAATAKPKAKAKAKAKPAKAKPAKAKPAKAKPAKAPAAPASTGNGNRGGGNREQLQREILSMAREIYGDQSDGQLLALDPNDIDEMDPSIFYELLQERYGVATDPDNDYFGGYGGPISKTIDFIAAGWDGKTNKATETPPEDWLEDYVHPATAKNTAETPDDTTADKVDDNAN